MMIQGKDNYIEVLKNNTENIFLFLTRRLKC